MRPLQPVAPAPADRDHPMSTAPLRIPTQSRAPLARLLAVLLSVIVLGAAASGCAMFGTGPMRISARFTDSVGVYVGNDVSVLGIKVGRVTGIRPDGTSTLVDMEIDRGVRIPADAGAVTLSPSVVTDRRVELTPAYRGGPTMRDGDLIPLDRTRTPVEIDRVYAAVDRLTSQLNSARGGNPALADALTVTADTFAGNGEKLHRAVHGLAEAIGVGADQRDQLVSLIKDVDQLTATAARNDATIRQFATNLTEATALLDEQGPHLRQVLDNLDQLLDQTNQLIEQNRGPAAATVDNLRVTAHTLAGRTRELSEALDVLPTLFVNLYNIVDWTRGRARAHAGIDQLLLDTQLLQGVCQRLNLPVLCAAPGGAGQTRDPAGTAGLALLLLGGAASPEDQQPTEGGQPAGDQQADAGGQPAGDGPPTGEGPAAGGG
jgi:phospholipid/cholesterol/gamma-HCH transport system substrate-binding protein